MQPPQPPPFGSYPPFEQRPPFPPPPPAAPRARLDGPTLRHYWAQPVGRVLLVGATTVLVGCCCAGLVGNAVEGSAGGGGIVSGAPTSTFVAPEEAATPTPKPTATATPDGKAYANYVAAQATTVSKDFDAMDSGCGSADRAACRAALVTLDSDVRAFRTGLDSHPAPVCLQLGDTYLRTGLRFYDQGATEAISGIDANDTSLIVQGSRDMSSGTDYMDKALTAIQAAVCP